MRTSWFSALIPSLPFGPQSFSRWLLDVSLSSSLFLFQSLLALFFFPHSLDPKFSYLNYSPPQHLHPCSFALCYFCSENPQQWLFPWDCYVNYWRRKLYSLGNCQSMVFGGPPHLSPVFILPQLVSFIGHLFQIFYPPASIPTLSLGSGDAQASYLAAYFLCGPPPLSSSALTDLDTSRSFFCQSREGCFFCLHLHLVFPCYCPLYNLFCRLSTSTAPCPCCIL